jgi:ABC-type lipoprotein release transport system permease subunit
METSTQLKLSVSYLILIVLLAVAAFTFQTRAVQGEDSTSSVLWGHVVDAVTNQPIENATVTVWDIRVIHDRRTTKTITTLKGTTHTGKNGYYEFLVDSDVSGRVYAYSDDPHSPGYDYVPLFQSVTVAEGNVMNLRFSLVPAASILFEGDLLFVDSSRPPEAFSFTVVPEELLPESKSWVLTYGMTAISHSPFLNLGFMQVIIPVNTSIKIEVMAEASHTFVIDDPLFSYIGVGEEVRVRIDKYALPYNLNLTQDVLRRTAVHVNETERLGFYVTAERRDLAQASSLIEGAGAKFVEGRYDDCYADLREAYTKVTHIDAKVQFMYVEASTSTLIIIVFLALTSTSLAYLLYEAWAKKALATGLFYAVFIALLFHVYSGCQIVGTSLLLQTAGLALLASFLTMFLLPRLVPMTVTAFFSLAKRNLRRRRTRFLLTLVTVTALVMSFVALTSFSTEYGFTSTTIKTVNLMSEGLLIRKPLPTFQLTAETQIATTFDPLETSVLDWLQSKSELTLVVPKVENYPTRRPIGTLSTPNQRLSVFGVLGLSPNTETATTDFDQLLVEGQGRYLYDDEEDAIMISVDAADTLNVQVGERLAFHMSSVSLEVTVVGLLDDRGLSHVTDFDGSPLIPEKVIIVVVDGGIMGTMVVPCEPTEVVVTNWQTALKMGYPLYMSRIDVLAKESVDLLPLARQIALERDYWVWAAEEGRIYRLGLMTYLEAKGMSVFIPWFIVILNVVFTMVNAIYERRRELVILSSVGLNPTHITALFVAEALIVGIIGGGMGYLLGLSLYQLIPLLSIGIFVRQKISAVWCLASLGIAMTAVLVGAFVALKASVDITPSMLRRWTIGASHKTGTPWVFDVPFRVQADRLDGLLEYVAARYWKYLDLRGIDGKRGKILFLEKGTGEASTRVLNFDYHLGDKSNVGFLPFQLVAKKGANEDVYSFEVVCKGTDDVLRDTVSFLRMSIIEWSSKHNKR